MLQCLKLCIVLLAPVISSLIAPIFITFCEDMNVFVCNSVERKCCDLTTAQIQIASKIVEKCHKMLHHFNHRIICQPYYLCYLHTLCITYIYGLHLYFGIIFYMEIKQPANQRKVINTGEQIYVGKIFFHISVTVDIFTQFLWQYADRVQLKRKANREEQE